MPKSPAAFPLPPPPPAPGLWVRSLGVFWGIADGLWAAPGFVARTLADLPSAARRVPEALLDLGVSVLLLGFRRPAATLSLVLLVTGGPIAAAAAAPIFWDLEGRASTGPRPESSPKPAPTRDLARRYAPPAPPEVATQLAALDPGFPRAVGIAVMDVQTGWVASVQGDRPFPQQSVSKLWVALTVMEAVDAGRLSLDQPVTLTDADRSVFNQPITHLIENGVYQTSVGDLVQRALIQSDNAANDKLMALSGGPAAVQAFLASRGMSGIRLAEDQRQLQSRIAGLVWSPELSTYGAFEAETLRGGLTSLARGQAEAARALGLSRGQTLRHVLLPQTFRRVLPTLGNDLICLLKDSALVSVLGVRDITQEARLYQSATFRYAESLVLLAFFYLALTLLVALAVRALEHRYRRHAA